MHYNCEKFFTDTAVGHSNEINGAKVLELGSYDISLTIRRIFKDASEYIGVDLGLSDPGEQFGVDYVIDALKTQFEPEHFDWILSASLFEHTPLWREIISHNLQWLKPGGYLILTFGAEGNLHHGPEPWAFVPNADYLEFVQSVGLEVITAYFEEEIYGPDCPGGYSSLLRKPIAS